MSDSELERLAREIGWTVPELLRRRDFRQHEQMVEFHPERSLSEVNALEHWFRTGAIRDYMSASDRVLVGRVANETTTPSQVEDALRKLVIPGATVGCLVPLAALVAAVRSDRNHLDAALEALDAAYHATVSKGGLIW